MNKTMPPYCETHQMHFTKLPHLSFTFCPKCREERNAEQKYTDQFKEATK